METMDDSPRVVDPLKASGSGTGSGTPTMTTTSVLLAMDPSTEALASTEDDHLDVSLAAHAAAQALSDNDKAVEGQEQGHEQNLQDDIDVVARSGRNTSIGRATAAAAAAAATTTSDPKSSNTDAIETIAVAVAAPSTCTITGGSSGDIGIENTRSSHSHHIVDIDQAVDNSGEAEARQEEQHQDSSQDDFPLVCRICGRGNEDGRAVLRFYPVLHDMATATAAPGVTTFAEDLCLHVFCGKTASILPHVQRPDLEILTKAGLKNKHGIGPEVNAALARTRSATLTEPAHASSLTSTTAVKEKQYYLVREFEAHLAAIRHTHLAFDPFQEQDEDNQQQEQEQQPLHQRHNQHQHIQPDHDSDDEELMLHTTTQYPQSQQSQLQRINSLADDDDVDHDDRSNDIDDTDNEDENGRSSSISATDEALSVNEFTVQDIAQVDAQLADFLNSATSASAAPAGLSITAIDSTSHAAAVPILDYKITPPPQKAATPNSSSKHKRKGSSYHDERVRCGCGGMHWPVTSSKGASSWRSHVLTKRHQKWVEQQQRQQQDDNIPSMV